MSQTVEIRVNLEVGVENMYVYIVSFCYGYDYRWRGKYALSASAYSTT